MESRKSKRYRPGNDVLVALYLHSDTTFVGYLTDLSRSGLGFRYLAFNRPPAKGPCRVILANNHCMTDPIECRVVREIVFPTEDGFPDKRHCGLEFSLPLDPWTVPILTTDAVCDIHGSNVLPLL